MAKVKKLPEVLAHQIAAGEIVERPASIVKELVENAIDAQADNILLDLIEGGKTRIKVRDNGFGMNGEDAELAFEHHATSKISSIEDLHEIKTLGFRGEALPSIASVSRLRVRTAEKTNSGAVENPSGVELVYEGGICTEKKEVAWPPGTEILVEDLFFNVPVRKKFLKTKGTELSHISRLVTSYALASHEISFKLEHEGRKMIDAPGVSSIQERIFQLFGKEVQSNLVEMDHDRHGIKVTGLTSLPHEQKNNPNSMYLFVNGRLVRDKVLTHAVKFSYQDRIPSSAYPFTVLFIQISPREIDVNVHPAKIELRFNDSRKVHSAIYHAIEEALILHSSSRSLSSIGRNLDASARHERLDHSAGRQIDFSFTGKDAGSPYPPPEFGEYRHPVSGGRESSPDSGSRIFDRDSPWNDLDHATDHPASHQETNIDREEYPERSSPYRILGQFRESFIVAADQESLLVIDQHVAHERILYEQSLKALEAKEGMASQALLFPETIPLNPEQSSVADEFIQYLNHNGYDLDWFGPDTLLVRAIPVLARGADIRNLFDDLLQKSSIFEEISSRDSSEKVSRLREKMAISLSCQAAIKVNTPLSREKMEWLVDSLFQCRNPYTCPHGRPIVLKLESDEILKGFKRL